MSALLVDKRVENTFEVFRAPRLAGIWLVIAGAAAGGLLLLLILSLAAGSWLMAGVSALALAASLSVAGRLIADRGRSSAALSEKGVRWAAALPDVQKEGLNVEVSQLAMILNVGPDQINDLQSTYVVAEDLALREIQNQESVPLMRHVTIGGIPFNAVLIRKNIVSCIDVSFILAPDIRQDKVDAMLRKIAVVKRGFQQQGVSAKLSLMLVLITQLSADDDALLRQRLNKQLFEDTPVDVDIRLLDFETLQRIYVTD
ncbi:MAG: hypothetical protein AB7Q37_15455 [Pyrinomonadaceae bacterium]